MGVIVPGPSVVVSVSSGSPSLSGGCVKDVAFAPVGDLGDFDVVSQEYWVFAGGQAESSKKGQ